MSEIAREPRQSSAPLTAADRLDSWKEIAAHLNRDISTVQRWEKREGLPIHRLPHDKGGSVFAFKSELDAWMNRGVRERDSAAARREAHTGPTGNGSVAVHAVGLPTKPAGRTRRRAALLAGVMLTLAGAAAWVAQSARASRADIDTPVAEVRFVISDPPVATHLGKASGDAPVAVSQDGSVLVYVGRQNGVERLYKRRLAEAAAAPIPGTEGAVTPFISPDGQWVGFTRFNDAGPGARLQKVALAGGAPVTICEMAASRGASWGADGRIVFAPHPDSGLWQVPAAGGVPEPLTRPDPAKGERSHRYPFVIADARLVLYTIAKSDITSFDDAVIAMRDLDSGEEAELIRGGSYPMYVAATQQLLYARGGTVLAAAVDVERRALLEPPATVLTDVVTFPFTGAAAVAISNTGVLITVPGGAQAPAPTTVVRVDRQGHSEAVPFPREHISNIRIAPDQRTVAMEVDGANSAIWVGDLRRATAVRLTPQWTHWSPVWSPDGTRVASTSGRGGARNLFVYRVDRPNEPEQLTTTERTNFVTSWSRDGRYLAYDDQTSTAARDVAVFDLKTRTSIPVIHSPADEYHGRFIPDGTYIAYVSDETGRPEVYLQTFPQPSRKVVVSRGGGTKPVWAPNGRELYYRRGDELVALPVRTLPALEVGTPRVLFSKRSYGSDFDVTDDGHFLLVEDVERPKETPLHVTINWRGMRSTVSSR
jgi:Tol biopolymer transport system component